MFLAFLIIGIPPYGDLVEAAKAAPEVWRGGRPAPAEFTDPVKIALNVLSTKYGAGGLLLALLAGSLG